MSPRWPHSAALPPSLPFVTPGDAGVTLRLRVTPGARRSEIAGLRDDGGGTWRLEVRVTAAADRGQANAAVIGLLADLWRLPKSALMIQAGASGRRKTVAIAGPPQELMQRLGAYWQAHHAPGAGAGEVRQ
jgi:uncharacterized protein (TIGR00251 family)